MAVRWRWHQPLQFTEIRRRVTNYTWNWFCSRKLSPISLVFVSIKAYVGWSANFVFVVLTLMFLFASAARVIVCWLCVLWRVRQFGWWGGDGGIQRTNNELILSTEKELENLANEFAKKKYYLQMWIKQKIFRYHRNPAHAIDEKEFRQE